MIKGATAFEEGVEKGICAVCREEETRPVPKLGTTTNPFEVYDIATLKKVGTGEDGWTLAAHYRQIKDIDLASVESWIPIGYTENFDWWYRTRCIFTGSYDGGDFTIRNLTIKTYLRYGYGLFYWISEGGVVKNTKLVNVTTRAW